VLVTTSTTPQRHSQLSDRDFERVCRLVRQSCGIHLGAEKRKMIEARLTRRLRARNIDSFHAYCEYLFSEKDKEEIVHFINSITTNKTDFFREPRHFDLLTTMVLPEFSGIRKPILVWSAACSSGEEPYTLAIILSEFQASHPGFSFRIFATDISTKALGQAAEAIYTSVVVEPIPMSLRKKYLLRSRDASDDRVRMTPEIRGLVSFGHLNFMDENYGLDEKAHVIFCRNALIYFDRLTQKEIVSKLLHYLEPGGYLFIGHSENLNSMNLPVTQAAPALYRKRE
jgi:chemotaxis protein methyltransferase CheR